MARGPRDRARSRRTAPRGRAAAPGVGQVKLWRVASASPRQASIRACCAASSPVPSRVTPARPPSRNCSRVIGKYQHASAQGNASSSRTLALHMLVTAMSRSVSPRKPRKTTVRFAGRPSDRTVANCKYRACATWRLRCSASSNEARHNASGMFLTHLGPRIGPSCNTAASSSPILADRRGPEKTPPPPIAVRVTGPSSRSAWTL